MGLIALHFLISKQCSWRDRDPQREEFTCRKISSTFPKSDKNVNTLTQPLIKNDCHNHAYHSRRTLVWIKHKQQDVLHTFSKGRKGWMVGSPAHPRRAQEGSLRWRLLLHCPSCGAARRGRLRSLGCLQPGDEPCPRALFWLRLEQTSFPWWLTWPDSGRVAWQSSPTAPCITSAPAAVVAPSLPVDTSSFPSQGIKSPILEHSASKRTIENSLSVLHVNYVMQLACLDWIWI